MNPAFSLKFLSSRDVLPISLMVKSQKSKNITEGCFLIGNQFEMQIVMVSTTPSKDQHARRKIRVGNCITPFSHLI